MPLELSEFCVGHLRTLHYVPEYLSPSEEHTILATVAATKAGWKQVSGRKLLKLGGQISEKTGALLQVPLPGWLQPLADRVSRDAQPSGLKHVNHVLINSYEPAEGIFPHEDGPIYCPCACIISVGGPAIMRFFKKLPEGGHDTRPDASVLLMPRSLLVFSNDAYRHCLHGINQGQSELADETVCNMAAGTQATASVIERSTTRVSLTLRHVLAVRKNIIRL